MYLIIGANGFLGSYILKNVLEKTGDPIIAVTRNMEVVTEDPRIRWMRCDITRRDEVDMLCRQAGMYPEVKAVTLAACHNPDLVEQNPTEVWDINVTALSYLVNRLPNLKCLFYPSTDSVYGNSVDGHHFKETDQLNPVNEYGRQKCAAEGIVTWRGYNVVRYPFLIAPSLSPVKKHFYDMIAERLHGGMEVEMFADSYRSSLNFDTAAALLVDLMEGYDESIPKILNVSGDGDLSKYDIGLMIAERLGADGRLVVPIGTGNGGSGIFQAERAKSTLMDNRELKRILGLEEIKFTLQEEEK